MNRREKAHDLMLAQRGSSELDGPLLGNIFWNEIEDSYYKDLEDIEYDS